MAPATAFFNHQLKGKFIRVKAKFIEPGFDHKAIYFRDYDQKNKIKLHADDRQRTKHNDFKVDDHVLVRQPKLNKFSRPFSPKRFQVKQTKHSLVTAENDDKTITRNASFFKKIHPGTDLKVTGKEKMKFTYLFLHTKPETETPIPHLYIYRILLCVVFFLFPVLFN